MRKLNIVAALAVVLAMASSPALAQGLTTFVSPDGKTKTLASHANPSPVGVLPSGPQVLGASGNVANASAVATLAGAAGKTTYIAGFECTGAGATAAAVVNLTITGLLGGTFTYTFVFPAGVTALATPLLVPFETPLQASATNTAIVVTLPAGGAGNTNASCNAHGFQIS